MKFGYQPSQQLLEKYADVLVNFALGRGKGIKKGDIVRVVCGEFAEPLYIEIYRAIIKAGGHVIANYYPNDDRKRFNPARDFYEFASDEQLKFFPKKYYKALVDTIDHQLVILADVDKQALKGIDSKKMMLRGEAMKPAKKWLNKKENEGRYSWSIALYGTPAGAKEAELSYKEYWQEIIKACYLDQKDPVKAWKKTFAQMKIIGTKLNKLPIKKFHVTGPDVDLWIDMGKSRKWVWSTGQNIPSFEIFTSPDWRGTEGWIRFSEPLYRYGNRIEGIELQFKDGRVVKAKARKNERVLKQMIATPNADKVGEFSMTDRRFSKITKFMAETLFDENVGGKNGNTHIALGSALHKAYTGNLTKMSKKDWADLGFNDSSVHTDIVSTTPRTVTAILKDGKEKVIYRNGMFTL